MSDADRELRTGRLLAATPVEVLAAVTDGARLARWWGPAGFSNQFEIFEPRPGGRWTYEMIGPDGKRYPNEGAFVELSTARVLIHHRSKPVFDLELTLAPESGGTRLGWLQRFETLVPNAELRAFLEQANGQNLDRLEAELARGA
jgi:uncharacterized protein YndB with AHSA1/START domain